jgi:biopolymer transport protein ExbB
MFHLFQKGGPIMWPLLLTSIIALTVVFERIFFVIITKFQRDPRVVEGLLGHIERGNIESAIETGRESQDFVARVLVYGLEHRDQSFSNALLRAANQELKRFNQGLFVLDTAITLAPLLGLLATVTGMIHAFGFLAQKELDSPTVITGGIAEALIGTAFGLAIAILALIPFNYLNSLLEEARHEIEDAATHLELLLKPTHKV